MQISCNQLCIRTSYSLLESSIKIDEIFEKAKKEGVKALAIADKNNLFAAVKFYNAGIKYGIKPIIGCELSLASDFSSRLQMRKEPNTHSPILLYIKDKVGYQNLSELLSLSYENNEDNPYINLQQLAEHKEGLIAVVGQRNSILYQSILANDIRLSKQLAMTYIAIFSHENLYLALSSSLNAEEDNLRAQKLAFTRQTGIKALALNEVFYLNKEDAIYQDILYCIKHGDLISNENRKRLPSTNYYMHSMAEMQKNFNFCEDALYNTLAFAEKCQFDFDFGEYHMPSFENGSEKSSRQILYEECYQGLNTRYQIDVKNIQKNQYTKTIITRLQYELSLICKMGFEDYFLICWDFVKYAKEEGIQVGTGRGSGSGSLVCYLLGITEIDPIEYDLIFERFLNPERLDLPDLDIDFQDDRKSEIIDYVIEKYGKNRVAQIITFGTLSARAVIKDVGRVFGLPAETLNQISNLVPRKLDITIDKALEENPKFKSFYHFNEKNKALIDYAKKLEGLPRHSSIHAAGVVISKDKMTNLVPTIIKNQVCTQYDMDDIKKLGLVKMDFLSLKKLSIISEILSVLKEKPDFDFYKYENSYDDKKTFALLSSGNNTGIFQLESAGMMGFFKKLRPKNIEDIIIGISIYRPGPSSFIPTLLHNRMYPRDIKYDSPLLKPILEKTYACLVYQEQVIEMARVLAGFTYGRADKIRRAMSKKDSKVMAAEKHHFIYGNKELGIAGAISNGLSEEMAEKIYDSMAEFAKYAFNKSHAAAYAIIAYRMAYLKANYPLEFITALLNSELSGNDKNKMAKYIMEGKKMGIKILPPSVQKSAATFSIEGDSIRYGLSALKYLGSHTVKAIENLHQLDTGFPQTLEDFYRNMPSDSLNKKSIEALAFSGALDCFGINKASIIHNFDKMHSTLSLSSRHTAENQLTLGDFMDFETSSQGFDYELQYEYDRGYLTSKLKEVCFL